MTNLSLQYQLSPGDRLIHPIDGYPLAKHNGIFLGVDKFGNKLVSENHKGKGQQVVTLSSYLTEYGSIQHIEPFTGSNRERYQAIKRALWNAGKPYDLITNNCEHYANYVQTGVPESKQVRNVFLGVISLFIIAALAD